MANAFIFIFFVGFVVFLVAAFVPKFLARFKRSQKFMLATACFVLFVAIAGMTPDQKTEPTSAKVADKTESTAKPTEAPFNWTASELTEDNVRTALKSAKGGLARKATDESLKEVSVTSGDVVIALKPFNTLNERAYVRQMGETMIAYSRVLFENPAVEQVVLNGYVETTGGGEAFGVQIIWTRATHEAVDYDKLLDDANVAIEKPYTIGEDFTVKPVLLNGMKEADQARFK